MSRFRTGLHRSPDFIYTMALIIFIGGMLMALGLRP